MPKGGKKGLWNKSFKTQTVETDVTLNDFANNEILTERLRKPALHSFVREVKQFHTSEDKSWYEKDLEEFDSEEQCLKNEEGDTISAEHVGTQGEKVPKVVKHGCYYPLDIWFTLSEYIRPEDVATFAALCSSAYFVVRTYTFWINIYKRYYNPEISLPEALQPTNIDRPYCLRASVIRSLYYMYPPFTKRLLPIHNTSVDEKLYRLNWARCVSLWRVKQGNKWVFYFKFVLKDRCLKNSTNTSSNSQIINRKVKNSCWMSGASSELSELIENVNINCEEGCCVLCMNCQHFISTPPSVMGCHLAEIRVSLSRDMRNHRIQLGFTSRSYQCSSKVKSIMSGIILDFDSVETVQVLNWWHPRYPAWKTS